MVGMCEMKLTFLKCDTSPHLHTMFPRFHLGVMEAKEPTQLSKMLGIKKWIYFYFPSSTQKKCHLLYSQDALTNQQMFFCQTFWLSFGLFTAGWRLVPYLLHDWWWEKWEAELESLLSAGLKWWLNYRNQSVLIYTHSSLWPVSTI